MQSGLQHTPAGKAQFQLLGGGQLCVGNDLAAGYKIGVACKLQLHVLQGLLQRLFVREQPGVQPHEKPLLKAAHALGKVFLHRYFAQQGMFLFYLFGGLGKGGLQVLGGQV